MALWKTDCRNSSSITGSPLTPLLGSPQLSYLLANDLAPSSTCLPKSCSFTAETAEVPPLSICKDPESSLQVTLYLSAACHQRKTGTPTPSLAKLVPCLSKSDSPMAKQFANTVITYTLMSLMSPHIHPLTIGLNSLIRIQFRVCLNHHLLLLLPTILRDALVVHVSL